MNPTYSLLYAGTAEPEVIYEKSLTAFLPPLPLSEYDAQTVDRILRSKTDRRDFRYRREILEELGNTPGLLSELKTISRKWEDLKTIAVPDENQPKSITLTEAVSRLKADGAALLEHLRFLRSAAETLKKNPKQSEGLRHFSVWFSDRTDAPDFRELFREVGEYPMLKEKNRAILHFRTDENGLRTATELVYFGSDDEAYREKDPGQDTDFTLSLPSDGIPEQTICALNEQSRRFRRLIRAIRECGTPLKDALAFYEFGLTLAGECLRKTKNRCFPVPVPEPPLKAEGVSGIGFDAGPEDFVGKGMELFSGEAGTTTLRRMIQTQLFSAAGLPVLASGEVRFCPGQRIVLYAPDTETAREEAERLTQMFRAIEPNDLLLLHHPRFTGEKGSAEEIRYLLTAFRKKGAFIRLCAEISETE